MHTHPLHTITNLQPGDHLCCIYRSEDEHKAVLAPFLRQGLERGEKVIYVADTNTMQTIWGYLRQNSGPALDVEACLGRGQLLFLTHQDAYARGGVFDPQATITLLRKEMEQALAEGYPALRVTGEMTWALRDVPGSERLIEYETWLNKLFPGSRCTTICQYDRRRFPAKLLLDVLRTHPIAVIGTEVYSNSYYVPPDTLLSGDPAEIELERWIHNLAERQQGEQALQESETRFHELLSNISSSVAICEARDDGDDFFILDINRAGERISQVERDSIVGRSVLKVFPGVKESGLFDALRRVWRTGEPQRHPATGYKDERFSHWAENYVYKLTSGEVVVVCDDVTECKEMEDALRERVKELTCLYAVSRDMQEDLSVDEICRRAVEHLVLAMQFSEITVPVIELNGKRFTSEDYSERLSHGLHAEIRVGGEAYGHLWVYYVEERPFLISEEQNLVNGVAEVLGMWLERKRAEEALWESENKMKRALYRQAVVNQLALTLGVTSDLDTIYHTAYERVHDLMDCEALIISFYDRETDLLHAGYAVTRGTVRDVAYFPPIPLEEEGRGTQSQVIRTGEPLYIPDYCLAMDTTETKYKIDEEGNVIPGTPSPEEDDSTRSALYVPMKIEGQTVGVMQIQSHRLDGYDQQDRDLLAALANVVAIAVQNARLFESLRQSNQELKAQRANLEELVAQRTTELSEQMGETEQLNRALANLLEDIQVSNRNLERATQQLKQANEELESFSYSVSHDLRAPLRAIDGFSRILQDEYASELSPKAQRYLSIVRDNAQQMSQLIDDLLAFSRLSRRPLSKQAVSPANLARQVLGELAHEYEGRQVEFTIGDLPACQADPSLLKQVYVNLLSNALKYTREREVARIEIGTLQIADLEGPQSEISDLSAPIYYFKDNGVGFDMRYADKLFGVFQRFHRAEDYEGTGVGLAIVQRIIHRHGGRVWAEAEVDKGATFYFTV